MHALPHSGNTSVQGRKKSLSNMLDLFSSLKQDIYSRAHGVVALRRDTKILEHFVFFLLAESEEPLHVFLIGKKQSTC
jgi:hypothetical protein